MEHAIIYTRHFFEKYTFWKITVLLALLFDTISTIFFMTKGGIDLEIHPMVRYSALVWGPIIGTFLSAFVYKAVVGFLLEAVYLKQHAVYMYAVMICTSTAAGFYNFLSATWTV